MDVCWCWHLLSLEKTLDYRNTTELGVPRNRAPRPYFPGLHLPYQEILMFSCTIDVEHVQQYAITIQQNIFIHSWIWKNILENWKFGQMMMIKMLMKGSWGRPHTEKLLVKWQKMLLCVASPIYIPFGLRQVNGHTRVSSLSLFLLALPYSWYWLVCNLYSAFL